MLYCIVRPYTCMLSFSTYVTMCEEINDVQLNKTVFMYH